METPASEVLARAQSHSSESNDQFPILLLTYLKPYQYFRKTGKEHSE